MKGSNFIFDRVNVLYYKCHKIYLRDSPDLIKNKKAIINPANDDDICFQYAAAVPLNHDEAGRNLYRISEIKPLKSKYNWKEINFPSRKDDGKKFEKIIQQLLLMCYV